MKVKVKKEKVIKEIEDESLLALYVGAGWKVVEDEPINAKKEKFNFKQDVKNDKF